MSERGRVDRNWAKSGGRLFSHARETQATVGGSPFGPFIPVARGHSRE